MKTIYLVKGSYQYQYDDPVEIIAEYFAFEENAQRKLESIYDECAIAHADIETIECTEDEFWSYYLEDEDELEEDEK